MKIRIRGNSLRLRLTQSEVQQFAAEGTVQQEIHFGLTEKERLVYVLKKSLGTEIEAQFSDNQIVVSIPNQMGSNWAQTDLVGLSHQINLKEDLDLSILVEKDFKCLTKRMGEDETDNFPNPLEKHPNC